MKLEELIDRLQQIVKQNPEMESAEVVFHVNEGLNKYDRKVHFIRERKANSLYSIELSHI